MFQDYFNAILKQGLLELDTRSQWEGRWCMSCKQWPGIRWLGFCFRCSSTEREPSRRRDCHHGTRLGADREGPRDSSPAGHDLQSQDWLSYRYTHPVHRDVAMVFERGVREVPRRNIILFNMTRFNDWHEMYFVSRWKRFKLWNIFVWDWNLCISGINEICIGVQRISNLKRRKN